LPERFTRCRQFAVAELGFGTGLNFLLTWQAWRQHAPATAHLDYLAVEKHPIAPESLQQIFALWPELAAQGQALLDLYPLALPGCHRVRFDDGRVSLTLVWGDAAEQLANLDGQMDAWYLDGFSPRSNPQMWSETVVQQVARLTCPGGTFSTFSVAGAVRRAVEKAGFSWQKQLGFGDKGQMLVGSLQQQAVTTGSAPWFNWPATKGDRRVAVVGGGIAGIATAYALTARQFEVTLLEQSTQLATAASGNPGGVISPFLAADHSLASRFSAAAFAFAKDNINLLHQTVDDDGRPGWFHPCGELRLAVNDRDRRRQRRLVASGWFPPELIEAVDAEQASKVAGIGIDHSGLFVAKAGWVEPVAWVQVLSAAASDGLTQRLSSRVKSIEWSNSCWQLLVGDGDLLCEADHLVLANASDARRLLPGADLSIRAMRGQIAQVPATAQSRSLSTVLGFGQYLLPAQGGAHLMGASYSDSDQQSLDATQQGEMLTEVEAVLPGLFDAAQSRPAGRVAWRATTLDRLPLVGPVSAAAACRSRYSELSLGRRPETYPVAEPLPNLYLNIGHGSRGLVTAMLCGEIIACGIARQVPPVDRLLVDALHPDRFLIRQLRRQL